MVTATLFGLALLTYAARFYIRTVILRQFFAEDGLLLFSVICLIVDTGLSLSITQPVYDALSVILHGPDLTLLTKTLGGLPEIARQNNAVGVLGWCTIFSAKLAFLFFFRRLIIHSPSLYMWWWWALAITLLSWVASTVAIIITCPYVSTQQVLCRWPSLLNYQY